MTSPSIAGQTDRSATRTLRVALVCMPFYGATRPSIQIGLLHAIAERAGFQADSYHLTVDLAARLTPEAYEPLGVHHRGHVTGEWLFSIAAFGEAVSHDDVAYFDAFPEEIAELCAAIGKDRAYLSYLRHEALPAFIEDCATRIDWGRYDVIGFTSTHQQNVASLALARRIKERYPRVRIVFGGANFEDEMGPEYVRAFPCIDYAVVGEGDVTFPALLRCLAADEEPLHLPGLVTRRNGDVVSGGPPATTRDLDALPTPNYDDYFVRVERTGLGRLPDYPALVPYESARGCWWGEKHHCTFCGLNGLGMAYRSKRPERVLAELSDLARRYRRTDFEAVDNILDMKYVQEFFGTIAAVKADYTFFYEVKANLTQEQLGFLRRGGVRSIQPGIESLSTHILQLMRKGCTMLQNVRVLKWARYYDMSVGWNILCGFPGETEDDYRRQLEVLRQITHLQPPTKCGRIWMERFSPYFMERDSFPIGDLRPKASYAWTYPAHVDLDRIAYFFSYTMGDVLPDSAYAETEAQVEEWKGLWDQGHPGTLRYRRTLDILFIDDARSPERLGTYRFDGPLATMYEFCSPTMHTAPQVVEHVLATTGQAIAVGDAQWALDEFCRRGLMLSEDGRYLSLALPVNPNW
jgi:ribosomal peptide maturation radical SAM protein 1